jgi:hypothetical protein
MTINKKDIYNYDKTYYFKHMRSLEGAANDELSHYYERSWEAIFNPINHTNLITYFNIIYILYGYILVIIIIILIILILFYTNNKIIKKFKKNKEK